MAVLNDQQRKFYEETRRVTKQEIGELENQIQEELQRVKQRIAELQNAQKAARQMPWHSQRHGGERERVI
jgi:gas vesicle protein